MHSNEIDFYTRLATGIARQFGSDCEVVVYDLRVEGSRGAVIAVENGQISGEKIGDGLAPMLQDYLRENPQGLKDCPAQYVKTADGKVLKSTTVFFRDRDGALAGAFTINYDVSMLLAMERAIHEVASADGEPADHSEPAVQNVNSLLDELIERSVRLVGKPVAMMSREDKIRAIGFLNDNGAFLVTKSGQKVCKYFGISKYTLYSYIDEAGKPEA